MNKEKNVINVLENSDSLKEQNLNNIQPKEKSRSNKNEAYSLNKEKESQNSILKISSIEENLDDFDYIIKIILVGESAVGKSNICKRYTKNEFDPNSLSTVSFELLEKIVLVDNEKIKACIWDTLGQERFWSISSQYYRATNGALFIFDLSNKQSFEKINKWVENYNNYSEKSNIVKFLVGNKSDLKNIKVSKEEIYFKTKTYEFDGYFETSALNGANINDMFKKLVQSKYYILYF